MSEIADKTPEQEYVESIKAVVEALKEVPSTGEVTVGFVNIWAQAKASEITTLNVVRGQLEAEPRMDLQSETKFADDLIKRVNDIEAAFGKAERGFDRG